MLRVAPSFVAVIATPEPEAVNGCEIYMESEVDQKATMEVPGAIPVRLIVLPIDEVP